MVGNGNLLITRPHAAMTRKLNIGKGRQLIGLLAACNFMCTVCMALESSSLVSFSLDKEWVL